MRLEQLCHDEQRIIFSELFNALDPRDAVAFSSASSELWALTLELRKQLKGENEAAAALCLKVRLRSCKELREAEEVRWANKGLTAADMEVLGSLGLVLPALKSLIFFERSGSSAGRDGVRRLVDGLSAGALPASSTLAFLNMYVGDAGASSIAAALGRGAMPRLKGLVLNNARITDAGLAALTPVLQQRHEKLEVLLLNHNPLGDEGLAVLLGGVLTKLIVLDLKKTQVTDAGCAILAAALDSGKLPALENYFLDGVPASDAAKAAVNQALAKSRARATPRAAARFEAQSQMTRDIPL